MKLYMARSYYLLLFEPALETLLSDESLLEGSLLLVPGPERPMLA